MLDQHCSVELDQRSLLCFQQVLAQLQHRPLPLVVGIGGPGGSGKSTLASWLRQHLAGSRVLSLDDFRLPRNQRPAHARFGSHPEANDMAAIHAAISAYRRRRLVSQPLFDSRAGRARQRVRQRVHGVLLVDGECATHAPLRELWDCFILVEAHWRTLLQTRLQRDISERGSSLEKTLDIYLHSNLRDYPRFAADAAAAADVRLYRTARGQFTRRR